MRIAQRCFETSFKAPPTSSSSPVNRLSSGRLGVVNVATSISRPKAATVASSASCAPLVATITGSNTIGIPSRLASRSAMWSAEKAEPIIPILTASTPKSPTTASICASTTSAGMAWIALTPSLFCAVTAVTAVMAWPPSMVIVLISA